MRIVTRCVFAYCVLSLVMAWTLYGDLEKTVYEASFKGVVNARILVDVGIWVAPMVVLAALIAGWQTSRSRLIPLIVVCVSTVVFHVGFSFFKNAIPEIVPYFADPALAKLDQWLHFNTDPWTVAHKLITPSWGQNLTVVYLAIWTIPALSLPILLMTMDRDLGRVWRYICLYFGSWVVLGNLVAMLGSSVGPVFYDRLLGGDRFAELTVALQSSGMTQSAIGSIQEALWRRFETGGIDIGHGISAFPSTHVSVATIAAIYLCERSRWLAPVGFGFLGITLFMSVYTGYHYAIDGYFSIAAVFAGNWLLIKHQNRAARTQALQSIAA